MKLLSRFKPDKSGLNPDDKTISHHDSVKKGYKNISSTLILLISAPLLAIIITSNVFHSYEVEGLSMDTTLQDGDRLIVYKFAKTVSNWTGDNYLPSRGDIIVFDRPKQLAAPNSVNHLIKRVIALPGERVVIKDGSVTVFNVQSPDGFNPDEGQEYAKDITTTLGNVNITVGQNEVFVLGDNRGNSSDSRVFGSIQTKFIVGNATLRFIPTNAMKRL